MSDPDQQLNATPLHADLSTTSRAWLGVASVGVAVGGLLLTLVAISSAGAGVLLVVPLLGCAVSIGGIVLGHLGLNDARKHNVARTWPVIGLTANYVLLAVMIVLGTLMILAAAALVNWAITA